ncbi:GFA family protein [Pseudomonas viridiflava]|uniref:GFA family protein n=1 Tax=Pseudomonas viridiflava TaxID=33069 RepID=UPI003F6DE226
MIHCHCGQCRKGHEVAFASYGSVPPWRTTDTQRRRANHQIFFFRIGASRVLREVCSTLFWSRSRGEFTDWVSIALGTLDPSFTPQKQKHVHVDSGIHWYTPSSSLPQMK